MKLWYNRTPEAEINKGSNQYLLCSNSFDLWKLNKNIVSWCLLLKQSNEKNHVIWKLHALRQQKHYKMHKNCIQKKVLLSRNDVKRFILFLHFYEDLYFIYIKDVFLWCYFSLFLIKYVYLIILLLLFF